MKWMRILISTITLCFAKERFVKLDRKDTNPSQVLDMDPEKIGRHFLGGSLPRICLK